MTLTLKIDNLTTLPDGGPLSVSIKGKRGLDIGRDQYLDWTLPDPGRFISGKHCEVRWHDGGYWLHDVSANGTYLQGEDSRLKEPHRLRDGDRFAVGHYIIAVALDDEVAPSQPELPGHASPRHEELWSPVGEAAPPMDPRELKGANDLRPVKPDFLNWAIDVPAGQAARTDAGHSSFHDTAPPEPNESWSEGAPRPPAAEPVSHPVPNPRRPMRFGAEPPGLWGEASAAVAPPQPSIVAARSPAAAAAGEPQGAMASDFVRLFARGAGLTDDAFAARDPAELAEQIGQLMMLVLANLKQLLEARQQAKRLARSSNQTMIQAVDNNPLKFAPTAEEAMRIMFGTRTHSYLDPKVALNQSFDDVKKHQIKTYAAMQHALKALLRELDPANIESEFKDDGAFASLLGSRKARLWDAYVARWQARTSRNQDGMLHAFMDFFAESYDRDEK
jgi:type VI secretion system protein ImpI